jgi:hypothetical protein
MADLFRAPPYNRRAMDGEGDFSYFYLLNLTATDFN